MLKISFSLLLIRNLCISFATFENFHKSLFKVVKGRLVVKVVECVMSWQFYDIEKSLKFCF